MKLILKTIVAAAMVATATSATAGGITVYEEGESKLKLEALFYLNSYSQTDDRISSGISSKTKTTGLAVDRAYFTAKYYFSNDWMMRFTSDMGQESNLRKDQNIYLKYAYVEGKLAGKTAILRVGQSHTPWIDYEQGLWKHRYVAKVMSDQYGFDTSADLGLGLKGKVADGMVDYFATVTNGSGYGTAARTNGVDFSGRLGLHPVDGLNIDFQYLSGHKGTKTFANGTATAGVKSTLMQAMLSYGTDDFRLGANYLKNKDRAGSATNSTKHDGNTDGGFRTAATGDEVKSSGYGVWGWIKFSKNFGAFGRYEILNNEQVGNITKEKISRYLVGLEYKPIKSVTFALVADQSKLKNRGGNSAIQDKNTRFGLYSEIKL